MRKRTIKPLPAAQKQTLLEMYRHHPKSRMRERAHIVLLSSQGRDMKEVDAGVPLSVGSDARKKEAIDFSLEIFAFLDDLRV